MFIQKYKNFKPVKSISKITVLLNLILLFCFLSLFFYFSFKVSLYHFDFSLLLEYKKAIVSGFLNTLLISFFALICSIMFGAIICFFSLNKIIILRYFALFYIEIIRGTPLLVQVLLIYYIIANNLGFDNRYFVGIFILSLFSGAYLAEIFRTGILSIALIQIESARALGLNEKQILFYVVFPQALKNILAPTSSQLANLIKDSSLLSVIAVNELTQNIQEINSYNFATLEGYIILAILYLVLTLPISLFSRYLEGKYQK
ncbi:amino acid ABC transporter permease [Campylobacter estrildidarum]|uniref:Amino acid ABC transporter permease n=1 Tax=Campylobacter estrildidarum TaxID=2510189 RepID=A0A4V6DVY2_9BACT|nr:amino acid ABC transporter permease [Campylobacter estrildidarum]TKX30022.1 amino acid ABC transporter permease [Campylobacter estrildidarum]